MSGIHSRRHRHERIATPHRVIACLALAGLLAAIPVTAEDDWYPSRYGADDTLGAVNLLKPEHVLSAAQLVKTGKTYALGVPTGPRCNRRP